MIMDNKELLRVAINRAEAYGTGFYLGCPGGL